MREWAQALPRGDSIRGIGRSYGVPIAEALIQDGFTVHGIDASATMIDAFRVRFPQAPVECTAVEDSKFFGCTFDGVVAWGLMFLLTADTQRLVIRKVA